MIDAVPPITRAVGPEVSATEGAAEADSVSASTQGGAGVTAGVDRQAPSASAAAKTARAI